jgi:hypothetical protein
MAIRIFPGDKIGQWMAMVSELLGVDNIFEEPPQADKISPEAAALEELPQTRGRRRRPPDRTLFSVRARVLGLAEQTWPDIGFALQQIRKRKSIGVAEAIGRFQSAFRAWETYRDCSVVFLLLRPSHARVSPKELRSLIRERERPDFGIEISEADQRCTICAQSLQEIESFLPSLERSDQSERRADRIKVSNDEREAIDKEHARRRSALEAASAYRSALDVRRKEAETKFLNGCTYFVWTELIDFCIDSRYGLNPLNLANALAGLPHLTYRRSQTRCSAEKLKDHGRGNFLTFTVIKSIVESCPRGADLTSHFEKALRTKKAGRRSKSTFIELGLKWYYLRKSIETVLQSHPSKEELPFKIASEHLRRVSSPTPVDRFMESAYCIRRDKIKRENSESGSPPVDADDKP